MTATQYYKSDKHFLGAFYVCEMHEEGLDERVSLFFGHYDMAEQFISDVEEAYQHVKNSLSLCSKFRHNG